MYALLVALPETIPVKYTEEEAEYLSVRPVVRQTFRLAELLDMVVRVTGKDAARVQHILRAGTIIYNFYRYSWPGFEVTVGELEAALARFPDPDPGRKFRVEECCAVLFESAGHPGRTAVELAPEDAKKTRLFAPRSFWDALLELAAAQPPAYREYSYARQADLYARALSPAETDQLAREAARVAPRSLRLRLQHLAAINRILFLCPR